MDVPESRINNLQTYTAYDESVAKPGNATATTCFIHVPYAHRLRGAYVSSEDINNVGAFTMDLMQADPGDAKAGTSVAQADDTAMASTTDTVEQIDFTLTDADKVETVAGRRYWLSLTGTNAGDLIDSPTLTLLIEPAAADRSTL